MFYIKNDYQHSSMNNQNCMLKCCQGMLSIFFWEIFQHLATLWEPQNIPGTQHRAETKFKAIQFSPLNAEFI